MRCLQGSHLEVRAMGLPLRELADGNGDLTCKGLVEEGELTKKTEKHRKKPKREVSTRKQGAQWPAGSAQLLGRSGVEQAG